MTVKLIAKRTAGLGCIEGDKTTYKGVKRITDKGIYCELYLHENRQVRVNPNNYTIEVKEEETC